MILPARTSDGSGTFDLQVESEGSSVWIELKVDGGLSTAQLEKQLAYTASGQVVYVMLGSATAHTLPWAEEIIKAGGGHVFTAEQLCPALENVAKSDEVESGVAHLALTYAKQLRDLAKRR